MEIRRGGIQPPYLVDFSDPIPFRVKQAKKETDRFYHYYKYAAVSETGWNLLS